jgi:hypothetical protein
MCSWWLIAATSLVARLALVGRSTSQVQPNRKVLFRAWNVREFQVGARSLVNAPNSVLRLGCLGDQSRLNQIVRFCFAWLPVIFNSAWRTDRLAGRQSRPSGTRIADLSKPTSACGKQGRARQRAPRALQGAYDGSKDRTFGMSQDQLAAIIDDGFERMGAADAIDARLSFRQSATGRRHAR